MDDLIQNFNINEVQKSGAIFDITKLDYLNSQHLSNLNLDEFKKQLMPFLEQISIDINKHRDVDKLLVAMRTSANTLKGIAFELRAYYSNVIEYDENALNKFVNEESMNILNNLKDIFIKIDEWTEANIDSALKSYQVDKNLSVPKVNQPIRIALTGSTKSPSLGLTLELFGKEESLVRLDRLLLHLKS